MRFFCPRVRSQCDAHQFLLLNVGFLQTVHLDFLDINRNLEEKVGQRIKQLKARMKEVEEALEQIDTLRGILPICMHCKKIRDDDGFWDQVETHASRHSDAQFSHGICPECYQQALEAIRE